MADTTSIATADPIMEIEKARAQSAQVRPAQPYFPLYIQLSSVADSVPTWWSPARDRHLDEFWKHEGLLSGTIYSMMARNAAYNWRLTGPDKAVYKAQRMLQQSHFGKGWPHFVSLVTQDLLTQDNGAHVEVIRPARAKFRFQGSRVELPARKMWHGDQLEWHAVGRNGALLNLTGFDYEIKDSPADLPLGLAHLDSQACWRTGDEEGPVIYTDRMGVPHQLSYYQSFSLEDMPTARERYNGIQFCAVSRVLRAAQILRDVRQYQYEKVSGRYNRAIHLVNVDSEVIQQQMDEAQRNADNAGTLRYLHPIIISTLDPSATPTVATIDLAGIPDGFDPDQYLRWYVTEMALGTGVDYGYLAPLPGSGLGSATQSETQARHARGKSARLFMNTMASRLNFAGVLPESVEFEFKETDYEEEAQKAGVASTRAATRASRIQSGEITPTIARQLAEDEGDLNHEYLALLAEEEVLKEEALESGQQPGAAPQVDPKAAAAAAEQVKKEREEAAAARQPGAGGFPMPRVGGGKPAENEDGQAVGKDGKPLAGAAAAAGQKPGFGAPAFSNPAKKRIAEEALARAREPRSQTSVEAYDKLSARPKPKVKPAARRKKKPAAEKALAEPAVDESLFFEPIAFAAGWQVTNAAGTVIATGPTPLAAIVAARKAVQDA